MQPSTYVILCISSTRNFIAALDIVIPLHRYWIVCWRFIMYWSDFLRIHVFAHAQCRESVCFPYGGVVFIYLMHLLAYPYSFICRDSTDGPAVMSVIDPIHMCPSAIPLIYTCLSPQPHDVIFIKAYVRNPANVKVLVQILEVNDNDKSTCWLHLHIH